MHMCDGQTVQVFQLTAAGTASAFGALSGGPVAFTTEDDGDDDFSASSQTFPDDLVKAGSYAMGLLVIYMCIFS